MLKWTMLATIVIAGSILWYFFQHIETNPPTPLALAPNAIAITHSFKDEIHRFGGKLRLSHSCYQVTTNTSLDRKNPMTLNILLTTKDKLLDQQLCFQIPTFYPFEIVAEAPQDIKIVLRVDGVITPTKFIETMWTDPKGTILNLENTPK